MNLPKKILFSIFATLFLLLLLELSARVLEIWIPPFPVDIGQGFVPQSRVFVPSPADSGMLVTNPAKSISFLPSAFTRHRSKRTFRIFFLGESSVNRLQPELVRLQQRLTQAHHAQFDQVEIINVGGNSNGSHRLVFVLAEVLEYEPSLILWHVGNNEFEEVEQLHFASLPTLKIQEFGSKYALTRLIRSGIAVCELAWLKQKDWQRHCLLDRFPDYSRAWHYPFTKRDVDVRMVDFQDNLNKVVLLCKKKGVPLVISTVPSNLWRPYLGNPEDGAKFRAVLQDQASHQYTQAAALSRQILKEATGRHQSSDLENQIIRSTAGKTGTPLVDVESAIIRAEPHGIPGETLFVDHCHLNDRGNAILIQSYEAVIEKQMND